MDWDAVAKETESWERLEKFARPGNPDAQTFRNPRPLTTFVNQNRLTRLTNQTLMMIDFLRSKSKSLQLHQRIS